MDEIYPNDLRISANYTCFTSDLNIEHYFKDSLSDVKMEEIIVVLRGLALKHARGNKISSPEITRRIFKDDR